jgi:hypothetical protein
MSLENQMISTKQKSIIDKPKITIKESKKTTRAKSSKHKGKL